MINKLNKKDEGFIHYHHRDGVYSPRIPVNTSTKLPPGIYQLQQDDNNNVYFVPQSSMTDQLIKLPDSVTEKVVSEVTTFWSGATKQKFDSYGLIYKRGILLYGKPGTGKTCTIARVMENLVHEGGIVLFNPDARLVSTAVQRAREIQPDLKVLVIWEEFDNMCTSSTFLSLLDGELQIDNVVYIATTNHIDQIPAKIKNRPSRFATVIEVGVPSAEARRVYLEAKLHGKDKDNIDQWVKVSNGLVIDQIKDLIVSVCCFDRTLKEAVKKIRTMNGLPDGDDDYDSDCDDDIEPGENAGTLSGSDWKVLDKPANKPGAIYLKALLGEPMTLLNWDGKPIKD